MATYKIVLGNPTRMRYQWQTLVERVHALFLPSVRKQGSGFDNLHVRSTMEEPTLAAHELLVYVLPRSSCSIVSHRFPNSSPGHDGLTAWDGSMTGSEVYVRNLATPQDTAHLIYHEALHNKLHLSDSALHSRGGLAASPVSPPLSQRNIDDMAGALRTSRTQWTGGFALIDDPLSPVMCL